MCPVVFINNIVSVLVLVFYISGCNIRLFANNPFTTNLLHIAVAVGEPDPWTADRTGVGLGVKAPVFRIVDGEPRIVSVISAKADVRGRPVSLGARLGQNLLELQVALEKGTAAPAERAEPRLRRAPEAE